jgi:hypothetical protein
MLYGYEARQTPSEGIHDSLFARATVFENNGKKLVLVSADLGAFEAEEFAIIQNSILEKFKLDESELFLTVIHTHSSPILSLSHETANPGNIAYTRLLNQKLLTVIDEALKNLQPVLISCGKGSSPVATNRREMLSDGSITLGRNPYGPADKEVLVMKVVTPQGNTKAAIFDFATHATSLGSDNMLISGDVLGISEQFVESILGKDIVASAFAGASGNIDPWYRVLSDFNTESGWIPEPVLLGTLLGEEVVHIFRDIREIFPGGELNTSSAVVKCPHKNSTEQEESMEDIPVNITIASMGKDVAFVGLNVEMFTEIGMAIKAASPFKYTFIMTHCNGYSGYLLPDEIYKEGGYEVRSTPFKIGSADIIVKRTLKMLYDMYQPAR